MTRSTPILAALLLTATLAIPAAAQVGPSPIGKLEQDMSGTTISLQGSRPSARGRVLFGDQVGFGEFWTPGANVATTIRFSKDVTLAGDSVAAGAYSLWMESSDSSVWRVMLMEDTTAFHVPHRTENDGFLVVEVRHETVALHQETLLLQLDSIRPDGAILRMHWGSDRVSIPIGVDMGVILTVPDDEAAKFVGQWERQMLPWSEEALAETRAQAEADGFLENFEEFYAESLAEPNAEEILFEDGYLMIDLGYGPEYRGMLIPRGNGFFMEGGYFLGAPTFPDPATADMWEFIFDDDGRAIRGELREDGRLAYILTRVEGEVDPG